IILIDATIGRRNEIEYTVESRVFDYDL
ncbi:MAG: hypothetical protein ACI8RD_008107, partial [Bacillariaceae sp.]